jgi:hypothetical protein
MNNELIEEIETILGNFKTLGMNMIGNVGGFRNLI